ncbi:helix-hairpin-helix domain-containing protein [Candidatus Similichlamydia epinepheli]|uniref:helix-hairpin-helix domain-containing protein n=1 Tax=Candidatus Similichlamydia epinepheli TaxID=1903953 RepID=UPI000D3B9D5F|nr:helix-hairpin-helix domain-containing protein [Candidatus Similichlamydia epinepheli]
MFSSSSTLSGIVLRITYEDPKGLFSVLRLQLPDQTIATLVGPLSGLSVGQRLSCEGEWKKSIPYGDQFVVASFWMEVPTNDLHELEIFLGSGNLPGIGPVLAKKIINSFGLETSSILDHHPDRLVSIPGITSKKADHVHRAWKEQRDLCNLMIFCQKVGLSTNHSRRFYVK